MVVHLADDSWLFLVTQAVIIGTIFLSITADHRHGRRDLAVQGTFAAIGGFAAFQLTDRAGMSVMLAALIGAAIALAAGAVLSLPVMRLAAGGHRHARLRLLLRR